MEFEISFGLSQFIITFENIQKIEMKYLSSKRQNIIVTMIFSNVCFVVYHYSGILGNEGMAAIIVNLLPIIIGLVTIILYFVVRSISEKNAWLVTVFGNILNLTLVMNAFWYG